MTYVCALEEKESIISCLSYNSAKFVTVDRLERKQCCSSIMTNTFVYNIQTKYFVPVNYRDRIFSLLKY